MKEVLFARSLSGSVKQTPTVLGMAQELGGITEISVGNSAAAACSADNGDITQRGFAVIMVR